MKLTKNCKRVLKAVKKLNPDNNLCYYTNEHVYQDSKLHVHMRPDVFLSVLDALEIENRIRWGDKEHSAFALTEFGRAYKELDRMDIAARWIERVIGFIVGVIIASVPQLISWYKGG